MSLIYVYRAEQIGLREAEVSKIKEAISELEVSILNRKEFSIFLAKGETGVEDRDINED